MELRNKNVLIFGGGGVIGRAIAERFLAAGAKVMIIGKSEKKLQAAAEEIGSPNLHFAAFDITDIASHARIFEEISAKLGGLDAFVNAAAICSHSFGRGYEPWDVTEEEWDMMTDINFKAAYFLMRNEINYLKTGGICGNILNIASNAACMDISGCYGASKESMIKWTRALGKRFGHIGIIINGIAPGATFTPMIAHYAHDIDQKYERHAIERFIRPDEIAELAFYLMSDYGEIICGHTVIADGGDNCATL